MTGFAASPGIDVDPTCSSRSTRSPSTRSKVAFRSFFNGGDRGWDYLRFRDRLTRVVARWRSLGSGAIGESGKREQSR